METSNAILERSSRLLREGEFDAALTELERVPEEERWITSRYWTLKSIALHGLEAYPDAIAAANWALSVHPHDPQLIAIRFESERAAGLFPAAELSILEAIRLRPQDVQYQTAYAWLLASAGQWDKAERVNAAARRLADDDVDAAWQAAELARLQGKDEEAVRKGYRILEASAPESFKRVLLGRLLVGLERDFEGVEHFKQSTDQELAGSAIPVFAATLGHGLVRPYRIIERIGPVRTPALLLGVAILLLVFNRVTAALVVAALMWLLFLYPYIAVPYASWRARRANTPPPSETP